FAFDVFLIATVPFVVDKMTFFPLTCSHNKDGAGFKNPSSTMPAYSPERQTSRSSCFSRSARASASFKTGMTEEAPSDKAAVIDVVANKTSKTTATFV